MKKDIQTQEDIKLMVDTFYSKAMKSEGIGHFFTEVIQLNMEKHMPVMYSFWSDILLGTKNYQGNPMVKHLAMNKLAKLEAHHFDEWLQLWQSNIDLYFEGVKAEEAKNRARSIAAIMQFKIQSH